MTPNVASPEPPPPENGRRRIGIDLGGTKTEIVVLDAGSAAMLRRRVETPRNDYPGTIATIVRLVAAAEREAGPACSVGVGIPGAISPATGKVKNANSAWLNGRHLLEDLQSALNRPVRIQNDANCLAMSESADGAGAGSRCILALILGTGVGAGICIDGQVLVGRNAIAGEWGHNPLPPASYAPREQPGPVCWCGRRGCIETWLSGPALALDFTRHARQAATPQGPVTAADIFRLAGAGDADAGQAVDRWLDRLARSLAVAVNLLDPDVIVVGGGVSNAAVLYRELPGRLAPHVFSDRVDTVILPAAHGDSSGVRGAAWLWP